RAGSQIVRNNLYRHQAPAGAAPGMALNTIPPAPPHNKGSPFGGLFLCHEFIEFEAACGFTNCQEQFVSPPGARRGSARDGVEYNPASSTT
ncbi:hypothetical protein, partial [Alteromonas lipotrueiana]|uniref:hypothetical protein n=1 Tax=Alteromonas lipotrueiana TaxID=2803815 RepID=UPI001C442F80